MWLYKLQIKLLKKSFKLRELFCPQSVFFVEKTRPIKYEKAKNNHSYGV